MKKIFLCFGLMLITQTSLHAMDLDEQLHAARIKSLEDELDERIKNRKSIERNAYSVAAVTISIFLYGIIEKTSMRLNDELTNDNKNMNIVLLSQGFGFVGFTTYCFCCKNSLDEYKKIDQIISDIEKFEILHIKQIFID